MLNKSMFTGKMTRAEMEHEHPAELAAMEAGHVPAPVPPTVLRQRQKFYIPLAVVLVVAFFVGFYFFVGYETTAIETVPPASNVEVFVPFTPTPRPTATSTPQAPVALTWDASISPILQEKCGACHGAGSGLAFDTYASFMAGGANGPIVVAGDSAASVLVTLQSTGGHPGQLGSAELQTIIDWVNAGALEK